MIKRQMGDQIKKRMFKGKSIILIGARQVGKTTLIENILSQYNGNYISLNGDESDVRQILSNTTSTELRRIIGKKKIVFIDEAQRIENIGLTIKIIVDQIKNVQVIVSGSSILELADRIKEPLTGRKYNFELYPISTKELINHHGLLEEKRLLPYRLIFGYYPEIVSKPGEEIELLKLLTDSYLYKDILSMGGIKKPVILEKLVKALSFQIGNEVSYNELGQIVEADKQTIEKYIDLLEKTFVVFRLNAYSKNVRNELRKAKKIYFYDNGIRNAVINDFRILPNRQDIGALWENFIISERIKKLHYENSSRKPYFWRTTQRQEIDYIEEVNNKLYIYEIKWNPKRKYIFPKTFIKNYSIEEKKIINNANYIEFVQ